MRAPAGWVTALERVLGPLSAGRDRDAAAMFAAVEAAAARRTGISEPPDAELRDGMRVLLRAFLAAPGLTPVGLAGARQEISRRIQNSLRRRRRR